MLDYLNALLYMLPQLLTNGSIATRLWHCFIFVLLPLIVIFIFLWKKPNKLWMAPLIAVLLNVIGYLLPDPVGVLTNLEARGMLLGLIIPMHLMISFLLTAVVYGAMRLIKHRN